MTLSDALEVMLPPFVLCVLMVGMLSYLGIHVIKREIIFVDLALAQIAALGVLIGFMLGIPLHTPASYCFALALTAIAAGIFTLTRTREARVPQEAVIGLVYAIAAAMAFILTDKAAHGAQHIKDILTGSILWVQWGTVGLVGAVYAGVAAFHYVFRRHFLSITENAEAARARGIRVGLWDFLFYLTFGLVITVSVGSAGVLLVFVFLVAPAVMAVLVTSRLLYQLLFGWALGVVVTITGLTVSLTADLSSGPMVIAAYALALLVVSAVIHIARSPDRPSALRHTGVIALAFAACFALLYAAGRAIGARQPQGEHAHAHAAPAAAHHEPLEAVQPEAPSQIRPSQAPPTPESGEDIADRPASVAAQPATAARGELQPLVSRFEASDDPAERADLVCEAIRTDLEPGAELALRFLEGDPPPFFAQTVADELDAHLATPSGFDVFEPFSAAVNQKAAARVRELARGN